MKIVLLFTLCYFVSLSWADEATVSTEEDGVVMSTSVNLYEGSPAISTMLAFTVPPFGIYTTRRDINLPAGKPVSFVASLIHSNPSSEQKQRFTLDLVEASLHYPLYYDYYIQNFTAKRLQNTLEPGEELFEVEEGVDTEMIFLVILIIALSIAVFIGIWHWCGSKTQRKQVAKQQFSKLAEFDNDKVVENEYIALLNDNTTNKTTKKKGRSGQTVYRRQGKH